MFVHLNCHSYYSFLAGTGRVKDLVHAAARVGCPALALTDTNGLYGAVEFCRAARESGLHPVFGAEVDGPAVAGNPAGSASSAVLLAKNLAGFGDVCRVVTDRHLAPGFSLADRLRHASPDVVILSRDVDVLRAVLSGRGPADLYAELTRPGPPPRGLADFVRKHRLPCVATNRVFFIHPQDWDTHRLLAAMRTNTTVRSLPVGASASPETWLKPPRDMARLFRDLPQALLNTGRIAERCQVDLPLGETRFPPFELPLGEEASSYLSRLAWAGARRLYRERATRVNPAALGPGSPRGTGAGLPDEVARRLRQELEVIDGFGIASYFLIVWDIVREAHARGIPTVGRGSAANSLVCRALGITEVDPIRHHLYFERFLNPERTDCPDIDIDFPWNRRDEILEYVFEKYGRDRTALISTHVHFRGRSALREVGKAIGIPIAEIDAFTRRLPHSIGVARLGEARDTVPECRNLPLEDEPYRTMIGWGRRIDEFPRHLSIHCGGIVISPFPITDRIPLQRTPKGFVVTQYDMYPVEDMGLLKIDLLAQKGLAVLADTVREVARRHRRRLDFARIDPTRDSGTRNLVREGRTMGCFYIESPGMRNLLQRLRVETFDMLTAASSIIRPGVSDSGMMKAFIDRHNGREKPRYLHPRMEELLGETFGVMIYQEDVIKVAHAIGGMSLGEADRLRKCMSKKRDWEHMDRYRERFLAGARANGVTADTAEEIWRQMESFGGYAFCKAHSASFARVSYQTAYLKAHYPAEFMAAVLSNRGGFYDTCAYVEEARRMGLTILPPHVNYSEPEFRVEGPPGAGAGSIRIGLAQVKGLSNHAIGAIVDGRKGGLYSSPGDFLSRAREVQEREVESLIRCGALDGLGGSRPEMLWGLRLAQRRGETVLPLLPAATTPIVPRLPEYGAREKLLAELEHLDLTVSEHLLALYPQGREACIAARDLSRHARHRVTLAGWLISASRTRTRHQEMMKFLTLEDTTAPFEVTLFPKIYRRFGALLYDRGPYIVKGIVERDGDACTVTALWLGRAVK